MTTLITAVILALLGAGVLGYVCLSLIKSFAGTPAELYERSLLYLSRRRLAQTDRLLAGEPSAAAVSAALYALERSFCLDCLFLQTRSLRQLAEHHEQILGRVVGIADHCRIHLDALPELEELLQRHLAMLKEYGETLSSRSDVQSCRAQKGKDTPDWALSEFTKKLRLLEERMSRNRREIMEVARVLFRTLRTAQSPAEERYH